MTVYEALLRSSEFVRNQLPASLRCPVTGVICGSGLGGLARSVRSDLPNSTIDYSSVPGFPTSTVRGHAGKLVFGFLELTENPVVLMVGRVHYYEGHSIQDTTFPVRVLKLLGIRNLIVTNAAGGLNPAFAIGDIMILSDHLNLVGLGGMHPLAGPNIEELGPRFPSLSDAYDLDLRRRAHSSWNAIKSGSPRVKRSLHEGVYVFVAGPSYETRAECRMLQMLGGDVVGMSTVPEVIAARHCGLRVLAISLVTNKAVLEAGPRGDDPDILNDDPSRLADLLDAGKASHEEVLQAGHESAEDMQLLVQRVIESISSL